MLSKHYWKRQVKRVRIIKLTMNAFMTYKDFTVVDFENMLDHGLYLISGPTGSGKTTLFDAITFALYGEASGSHRHVSYFRSDFADAKDETYVELTFELHQHIYTIKRSPTYYREGYKTPKNANAYLDDGENMIEGVKEVNAKIKELLGVDVHQFKQIVMIAQGEFTKLIYASSEERERVLRHVFHSESLVVFENLLKEQVKTYKDQFLLSSQALSSRFSMLQLDSAFMNMHQQEFHPSYIQEATLENEKLHDQLQHYQTSYQNAKASYDQFANLYYQKQQQNLQLSELQQITQQYQTLQNQEKMMASLKHDLDQVTAIKDHQSLLDQYQQIKLSYKQALNQKQKVHKQLETSQKQFEQLEREYQQLEKEKQQKDQLLLDIDNTKQSLEKYQQYHQLLQQYQNQYKQYQSMQNDYQNLQSRYEKLDNRIQRDQENVNRLPRLELELEQNEKNVKDINKKRVMIHELSQFYDEWKSLEDHHYDLSVNYQKKHQKYEDILVKYRHEDELFRRQQAGILASHLKENEPCPVCGSTHHPHLAQLETSVLSSHELENLSQQVEVLNQQQQEAYQDVFQQNELVQQMKTRIEMLKKQLDIQEELSKEVFIRLLSDIVQVIDEQEKTYQKKYNDVIYLKKIQKNLKQDHLLLQQQNQYLQDMQNQIINKEKQLSLLHQQYTQLQEEYHLSNEQDISVLLKQQQIQFQQLDQHIHDIENQYHQCQKDISVYTHQLETFSSQIDDLESKQQAYTQRYQAFIDQYFDSEEQFLDYQKRQQSIFNQEKDYQNYIIQKEVLGKQKQLLEEKTKDYHMTDLSLEKQQLDALAQKRDETYTQYHETLHVYKQNQETLDQLDKDYHKNQDIFEKYTLYQDLYDYTSGKNPLRMSFERYVLSAYFEQILEFANIELLKMTQGRFALYRKKDVKGVKQQGLDLSVLDYETGMMRDIQSLSGGESFKAALSLALGLSSMIQNYAGGIELNTLFIDEGFGTLDHESIDQALSVLMDLKNDHKTIGIISHVDELKERIDTQIIVEKGQQGSSLHIERG